MRRLLAGMAVAVGRSASGSAQAQTQTVVSAGHVDYAARIVDDELRSQVKDSVTSAVAYREAVDVVLALGRSARLTLPRTVRPASLGRPGESVWVIPQVQKPEVPWLGWNTESLEREQVSGDVAWTLRAVEGPGTVAVFQTGSFGEVDVLFDSSDGLPDTRTVPVGVHAHGNWAFTRPGSYVLTMAHRVTRVGGSVQSDERQLRVEVSDADDEPAQTPGETNGPGGQAGGGASGAASVSPSGGGGSGSGAPGLVPGAVAPRPPEVSVKSARSSGRRLSFSLRLDRRARLVVTVRRAGRDSALVRSREVPAGARTLRVALDRRLRRGTHTVTVRATAEGRTATRTLRVRVR